MGALALLLLLPRIGYSVAPGAVVPETVVHISIFDLGSVTKKSAPRLPDGYGQSVAEKIAQNKEALLDCLARYSVEKESWKVNLKIRPNGSAQAVFAEDSPDASGVNTCARKVLSSIPYPPHPMKHPVEVDFPLELSRRSL